MEADPYVPLPDPGDHVIFQHVNFWSHSLACSAVSIHECYFYMSIRELVVKSPTANTILYIPNCVAWLSSIAAAVLYRLWHLENREKSCLCLSAMTAASSASCGQIDCVASITDKVRMLMFGCCDVYLKNSCT